MAGLIGSRGKMAWGLIILGTVMKMGQRRMHEWPVHGHGCRVDVAVGERCLVACAGRVLPRTRIFPTAIVEMDEFLMTNE